MEYQKKILKKQNDVPQGFPEALTCSRKCNIKKEYQKMEYQKIK